MTAPNPPSESAADVLRDALEHKYREAVLVVQKAGRCSTSLVQRHLQVGYNKAASLVERMEREGIVTPPDSLGARRLTTAAEQMRDLLAARQAALATPTPSVQDDEVTRLRAERDRLRSALVTTCNNIGAYADDRVSSDFLMHIPEEARLVLAKAKERAETAEARVKVLESFVAYVVMWRDRGPPHGDPVTAWSAVSGHPAVGRAHAALSQDRTEASHGE